jgi:hypothetical protein
MKRRTFLASAASGPLALSAAAAESPRPAQSNLLGEPYELAGKRMVFLNWYYVRTGSFAWMDSNGKKVGLTDAVPPAAARFKHFDQPYGIRIKALLPQRASAPLLNAEHPWEEGSVTITTVIKDGGMYRGWGGPFTNSGNPPGQKHYMYFESIDGIEWKRPKLGIVEENGSRQNNIVNIFKTDGGSIFVDPSAPPSERYKLIAEQTYSAGVCDDYLRRRPHDWDPRTFRRAGNTATGMTGAVSSDGLHWTQFQEPMVMEVTDTQLTAYYDPQIQKYVAYTRTWVAGPRSKQAPGIDGKAWQIGRRSIGRSETSNYREFPLAETILEPSPDLLPTDLLYTNAKTTIPGAPDHHLLFPTIWHTSNDNTSVAFATSHDGKLWHFLNGSPVLSTGDFGSFDGGCIFAHPNLAELGNGDWVLPYSGYNVPHKYPRKLWKYGVGYATWPKGRIVALEAPERGEFATVGIMPAGRKLKINAVTTRGGSILAEVAGLDGKPLPGRSFAEASPRTGDLHWVFLDWQGNEDLGHAKNMPIMLRFRMDQAQLFGLEFS